MVGDLVDHAPEVLDDLFENHLGFHRETNPHLFFWDVVRSMVDVLKQGRGLPQEWAAVLDFLEERFRRGDEGDVTTIVTSFLASLPWPGQDGYEIVDLLGPSLRTRFDLIRPGG